MAPIPRRGFRLRRTGKKMEMRKPVNFGYGKNSNVDLSCGNCALNGTRLCYSLHHQGCVAAAAEDEGQRQLEPPRVALVGAGLRGDFRRHAQHRTFAAGEEW